MIPPPASSMIGQTISHYRIVERLGGGGMGVVYKAVDTRLNRTVALKFLSADQIRDADAAARFRQEAQSASALDHPNICTVFEIDEAPDGQTFIAMAHYEGETLKQRIERGPLSVGDAVGIARQIAQGLAKAHSAGIVHRDIKPANLIVTTDGIVKILDFGIAKAPGQEELTRTGTTLGTLSYMAPEQLSGAGTDHRVDLWALGAVLHEMLAGQPPFGRDDPTALVSAILARDPAPLSGLRADVPEALQQVVQRALRKPREERYQSASEVERDLAAIATALTAPVTVIREVSRRRSPILRWGIAAALILAAAAGLWGWTTGANVRRAREELIPEAARLAGLGQYAAAFAVAEQAERLVPNDPSLQSLWPSISANVTLRTTPSNAEVFFREYGKNDGEWHRAGTTPLESVRVPQGVFQWRIEHAAAEPLMLVDGNSGSGSDRSVQHRNSDHRACAEGDPAPGDDLCSGGQPDRVDQQFSGDVRDRRAVFHRPVRSHEPRVQGISGRRWVRRRAVLGRSSLHARRAFVALERGRGPVRRSDRPSGTVHVGAWRLSDRPGRLSGRRRELVRGGRVRQVSRQDAAVDYALGARGGVARRHLRHREAEQLFEPGTGAGGQPLRHEPLRRVRHGRQHARVGLERLGRRALDSGRCLERAVLRGHRAEKPVAVRPIGGQRVPLRDLSGGDGRGGCPHGAASHRARRSSDSEARVRRGVPDSREAVRLRARAAERARRVDERLASRLRASADHVRRRLRRGTDAAASVPAEERAAAVPYRRVQPRLCGVSESRAERRAE